MADNIDTTTNDEKVQIELSTQEPTDTTQEKLYMKILNDYNETEHDGLMTLSNTSGTQDVLYPVTRVENVVDSTGKTLPEILEDVKNNMGIHIKGLIESYKIASGETISTGDFVEYLNESTDWSYIHGEPHKDEIDIPVGWESEIYFDSCKISDTQIFYVIGMRYGMNKVFGGLITLDTTTKNFNIGIQKELCSPSEFNIDGCKVQHISDNKCFLIVMSYSLVNAYIVEDIFNSPAVVGNRTIVESGGSYSHYNSCLVRVSSTKQYFFSSAGKGTLMTIGTNNITANTIADDGESANFFDAMAVDENSVIQMRGKEVKVINVSQDFPTIQSNVMVTAGWKQEFSIYKTHKFYKYSNDEIAFVGIQGNEGIISIYHFSDLNGNLNVGFDDNSSIVHQTRLLCSKGVEFLNDTHAFIVWGYNTNDGKDISFELYGYSKINTDSPASNKGYFYLSPRNEVYMVVSNGYYTFSQISKEYFSTQYLDSISEILLLGTNETRTKITPFLIRGVSENSIRKVVDKTKLIGVAKGSGTAGETIEVYVPNV